MKNQKGFIALVAVLVVGAVGISIGTSLILLGLGSSRSSLALEQSMGAKTLADACAEEALQKVKETISFTGNGNLSLNGGTCIYTVTNTGGQNRTISTSGTMGTVVRKTAITLSSINPAMTITSWQEIP